MQLIHALISAIANPVRQIYSWFMQIVPGLKAIAGSSLPFRVSLMTLLFLLIIWSAAVIKHFWTASEVQGELAWVPYVAGGLLGVIVIPIIAYYLTKYLMIREESRYPEIDRIWYEALDECDRQGISLDQVPLFLGLGAPSVRFGGHLLKIAEMNMTVTVPKQGEGDISVYASPDAVFLFVSGCSCLSRLAAMPSESISVAPTPMPIQSMGDSGNTIDAAFFANQLKHEVPALQTHTPQLSQGELPPGATLLLPDDQDFSELLRGDENAMIVKSKQLSGSVIADCEDRLRHVCKLIKEARGNLCPINGILTSVPFETIDTSSTQLQLAAQKDFFVLREQLMVRCGNTLLVTDMESEEGFQELINRFGPQRSRDYRFGKGCELWSPAESDRLAAIGAHATGAFEDWIYMLFQDEKFLARRNNSRLYKLLCKMRGPFSRSLADFLAHGFGFNPETERYLANEQFLFGGCYFAATGNDPNRQAFVRSVLTKLIEQDGQLEWSPAARKIDSQFQLAANVVALIGTAALLAIFIMLLLYFS